MTDLSKLQLLIRMFDPIIDEMERRAVRDYGFNGYNRDYEEHLEDQVVEFTDKLTKLLEDD